MGRHDGSPQGGLRAKCILEGERKIENYYNFDLINSQSAKREKKNISLAVSFFPSAIALACLMRV